MTQTFIKIGATSYDAADYEVPAERTFRGAWEANARHRGNLCRHGSSHETSGVTRYVKLVQSHWLH